MATEKIITYTVVDYGGGPDLICTSMEQATQSLESEIEAIDESDLPLDFIIRVEKKLTQKQIDNLPEWE
jgi:hypothetical protein